MPNYHTFTEIESYIYVLWAGEEGIVKVGYSKGRSLKKRVSAHTSNSSNPLEFSTERTFAFQFDKDARRVEKEALLELHKRGHGYKRKKELFTCAPSDACDVVKAIIKDKKISAYVHFPNDQEDLHSLLGHFIGIPTQFRSLLNNRDHFYFERGFKLACRLFEELSPLDLKALDFQHAAAATGKFVKHPELWQDVIANLKKAHEGRTLDQQTIRRAAEAIANFNADAFDGWQEGSIP